MQPRREPLLWLQCLAIGVIPLELLLIRVLLAGADPGPVPLLERLLLWAVAVLAPAVALWRRPADWGSVLLLRIPTETRTKQQEQLSSHQGGLINKVVLVVITVGLLPLIWWLDESAGLVQELSPVQDRSRLVTLLLSTPLLALVVWQGQQLVQAILLLSSDERSNELTEPWDSQRIKNDRSSFGLQLLRIPLLNWPESSPNEETTPTPEPEPIPVTEVVNPEKKAEETDESSEEDLDAPESEEGTPEVMQEDSPGEDLTEEDVTEEDSTEEDSTEEDSTEEDVTVLNDASLEEQESISSTAAIAVEPEQSGKDQESTSLDAEVVEGDAVAGGEAEQHGEQPEPSRGEESDPNQTPESTPGGL